VATPGGAVYLPRPLRVEADMALVLSEAAGGIQEGAAIAGTTLLRPAAGSVAADALRTAADALAWWHTADIDIAISAARTATNESRRAQARLDLLAAALPRSEALHSIGDELRTALAEAQCGRLRLVHGAFRPNQLVFIGPSRAAITDLDGAGAGDPAVDVGDFCAHLRPPGLWCGEADQRAWLEGANGIFQDRYREAMVRAGTAPAEISGTLQRASLFEASSIVKMAGHRSRHLSSGRPREVATMLAEAGRCLARYQMWPEGLG
jgi:aminoglycoside phosphotransferase (APT) family kinase protein